MTDSQNKPLIPSRVLLVGENVIPREILDRLTDEQMQIFLREPDPTRWPPETAPLVGFLSAEERLKLDVWSACTKYEADLRESLERWTLAVWNELAEKKLMSMPNASLVIDEMVGYLRALVKRYLEQEAPPGSDVSR